VNHENQQEECRRGVVENAEDKTLTVFRLQEGFFVGQAFLLVLQSRVRDDPEGAVDGKVQKQEGAGDAGMVLDTAVKFVGEQDVTNDGANRVGYHLGFAKRIVIHYLNCF